MPQSLLGGVVLCVLAGLLLSFMATMYRVASGSNIHTKYILLVAAVVGGLYFGTQAYLHEGLAVPKTVLILALLSGATQVGCTLLAPAALRRGPLAAFWGANMLCFIPVLVFASLALREPFLLAHWLVLLSALVAIGAASMGTGDPQATASVTRSRADICWFAVILLAIILLNGTANIIIKALSSIMVGEKSLLDLHRNAFLMLTYAVMAAGCFASTLGEKTPRPPLARTVLIGLGAAVGSMFGSLLIMICASMPAAVVFTTSSVVSILGASLVGALIFHERKTLTWYVTVAGCVAAVGFAGLAARPPVKSGYAEHPAGVHSNYTLQKDARRGPDRN